MIKAPTLETSFRTENVFQESGEFRLNNDLVNGITKKAGLSLSEETCKLMANLPDQIKKAQDDVMGYFNGIMDA